MKLINENNQGSNRNHCHLCGSTYALQIDHIVPKAKGGTDDWSNLRLLCRSCNQRAAIQHYGLIKMNPYINSRQIRSALNKT